MDWRVAARDGRVRRTSRWERGAVAMIVRFVVIFFVESRGGGAGDWDFHVEVR